MKPMFCPTCMGACRVAGTTCQTCNGDGHVMVERFPDCVETGCTNERVTVGGHCADHLPPNPFVLNIEE